MKRIRLLCWGLLYLLMIVGCTKSPYTIPVQYVEGTVTVDRVPIKGVNVTFVPKNSEGELATGVTDEHGKYRLTSANGPSQKGALVGDYSVTLRKIESTKSNEGIPRDEDGMPDPTQMRPNAARVMVVVKQLLPVVYNNVKTTPFNATVDKKRKNVFNFDIDTQFHE